MSAFETLFLSKVYSSFLSPMVRRIVTRGFGVGNRAGVLVKIISTENKISYGLFMSYSYRP